MNVPGSTAVKSVTSIWPVISWPSTNEVVETPISRSGAVAMTVVFSGSITDATL